MLAPLAFAPSSLESREKIERPPKICHLFSKGELQGVLTVSSNHGARHKGYLTSSTARIL